MRTSTRLLRSDLSILSNSASQRTAALLAGQKDPDVAKAQLIAGLRPMVKVYGMASLAVATNWYDDTRRQAGVKGRYRALAPPPPDEEDDDDGIDELVGWGLSPVYSDDPDWALAGVLLTGGVQRRVLAPARESTKLNSVRDPQSKGWKRDGEGKCDYCRERIDSGVIFRDGELACHDRCGCQAVPAWNV